MRPTLYWIRPIPAGRLAILPRPRAGDWLQEEISAWRDGGIETVVSLLEQPEIKELGLAGEESACVVCGLEHISFPISDRGTPESMAATRELVGRLPDRLTQGKGVGVHCRAGIGRSALIAACVLMEAGSEPAAAFQTIALARGVAVPDTDAQIRWAERFYDFLRGQ